MAQDLNLTLSFDVFCVSLHDPFVVTLQPIKRGSLSCLSLCDIFLCISVCMPGCMRGCSCMYLWVY